MSVHLKCERCGVMEQTGSVVLFAGLTGPAIPTARPELPDGWTRPQLPTEDGELRYKELCPGCKSALFAFMRGAAVPGLAAPEVCRGCGHAVHDKPCRELTMPGSPGDVDECGCTDPAVLGVCRGCGHHESEGCGCPPSRICPGCGHLRHADPCPDYVSEVGPCGCKELTPRERMKELGIDD